MNLKQRDFVVSTLRSAAMAALGNANEAAQPQRTAGEGLTQAAAHAKHAATMIEAANLALFYIPVSDEADHDPDDKPATTKSQYDAALATLNETITTLETELVSLIDFLEKGDAASRAMAEWAQSTLDKLNKED